MEENVHFFCTSYKVHVHQCRNKVVHYSNINQAFLIGNITSCKFIVKAFLRGHFNSTASSFRLTWVWDPLCSFVCVCLRVRFTFGWSQHISVTEAAYKHNSSEWVKGRGTGAQVLHCDIPHLQTTENTNVISHLNKYRRRNILRNMQVCTNHMKIINDLKVIYWRSLIGLLQCHIIGRLPYQWLFQNTIL